MQSQKFESEFQPEIRKLPAKPPVQRLLVGSAIAALSMAATTLSMEAASLTNWNFDPAANQLEITVKDGTTPRYFLMAQPARIVVDLPNTAVGSVSAQQSYSGAVRQIRVSQFEPGLTRIVMEISPGVSLAPGQVKLQKVGNDAVQSGNSRWVLRPLITKALSANAAMVKPSASAQSQPTPPPAPASVQPLRPSLPNAATPPGTAPPAATSANVKTPIVQRQTAAAENNLPAPPSAESIGKPTVLASTTKDGGDASKPNATVPSATIPATAASATIPATAAPANSVALAPVLPVSSPTSTGNTVTPLPPTRNAIDPNVALETQDGVAIAVPAPTPVAPTAATTLTSSKPSITTATIKPDSMLRSTAAAERSRVERLSATVKPAPATTSRSSPSLATAPNPALLGLTASDIPTTLAANSLASPPSVSVPPLTPRGAVPAPSLAPQTQPRQPEAALEALPAFTGAATKQPSVSVPPLIQVGTPSLGTTNQAPSAVEPVPPAPDASPNLMSSPVSVPPLQQPSTPLPETGRTSYDANTVRVAVPPPSIAAPSASVSVPLQPAVPSTPLPGALGAYDANTIRRDSSSNLAPPLSFAPLQQPTPTPSVASAYDANTVKQPPVTSTPASIVNFGQPLPATSRAVEASGQPLSSLGSVSAGVRQAFKPIAPNVLLPTGATLNLLYPGNAALSLKADRPQQEVLMLQTDLRDDAGNILAPAGSTVTGRFETTTSGSRFVTQAIAFAGRTLPLAAQSEPIDGSRQIASNNLALNSGIGVVAGGVLGAIGGSTGLGAIGGAAAGAAATFLTAPKPAIIQPGQIVQVRLTQDLRNGN